MLWNFKHFLENVYGLTSESSKIKKLNRIKKKTEFLMKNLLSWLNFRFCSLIFEED